MKKKIKDTGSNVLDVTLPRSWGELTDEQLRVVYNTLSVEASSAGIAGILFFAFTGLRLKGVDNGYYIVSDGERLMRIVVDDLGILIRTLEWVNKLPERPVRLSAIGESQAVNADLSGVPFDVYLYCENLYQGYLMTKNADLLTQMLGKLYKPAPAEIGEAEQTMMFYWWASLKEYLSKMFPNFFSGSGDGNLLGNVATPSAVRESMNSQIRALTKGDITKEAQVLAMDVWRALTELDAQAKEYDELKRMYKK